MPGGLVGVEDHVRADLVRAADDRLDVLDLARLEEDVADRDEQRALVDRLDDLVVVLADDDLEVGLRLVEVPHRREVAALVDDPVARPVGGRKHERTTASAIATFWCITVEPGGAPTMRPTWSPTVIGISHQPSPQARMPALAPRAGVLGEPLLRRGGIGAERVVDQVRRVLEDRELGAVLEQLAHGQPTAAARRHLS